MASIPITDPRVGRLLAQAQTAQRGGDGAGARRCYEQALAIDPGQVGALNALGLIALRASDASAAAWFERATAIDPQAGPLWLNLAAAHRAAGRDANERAALERVLALDQRNMLANYRLADLLERTGEGKSAVPHWHGLVTMLSQIEDGGPDVEQMLATARERLAGHTAALSEAIDAALTPARDKLSAGERRRFERGVDAMLGRKRIYANDPHGLHFPFLPADEFFAREYFHWLPAVEAATPAIVAEFRALYDASDSGFTPYVSLDSGSPENRWTPLDRSIDWSANYLWRFGTRDDAVCARCPRTAAVLDTVPPVTLPGQAPSAFFSVLKPGTRLPAHTGVSNIRAIVHLPLIIPEGCGFRVGGETREWRVGEAFAFDDTIEHEAWNSGPDARAVLIFDTWNPHLSPAERDMLQALFGAIAAQGSSLGAAAD